MVRVYPFLLSAAMIVVGLCTVTWLDERLRFYVTGDRDKTKKSHPKLIGDLAHLQLDSLRNLVVYWVDMTQATALVLAPLLGLIILVHSWTTWLIYVYAGATVGGLLLILWMALGANPATYAGRRGFLNLTPVTITGLVLDVAAGLLAYFIGP